jgi:hypothetical protein
VVIRNEVFQFVKALVFPYPDRFIELVKAGEGAAAWNYENLSRLFQEYSSTRKGPVLKDTRNPLNTKIDRNSRGSENVWIVEQTLCDEDGENDWILKFKLDLVVSRETQSPCLEFLDLLQV